MRRRTFTERSSLLGHVLRLPLRLIPPAWQLRVLRGPIRGSRWIAGSSTHGCWLGTYESAKVAQLSAALYAGDTFFDIGANVGYYTLVGAAAVGPSGKVFAFEPLQRNLEFIRRHLRMNNVLNVKVIEAAVSDQPGFHRFSLAAPEMGRLSESGEVEVRTIRLDEEIESGRLPVPRLLKINVEGAELSVLHGAEATLRASHPDIYLATHGWAADRGCIEFLETVGYRIERLDDGELTGQYELLATTKQSFGAR